MTSTASLDALLYHVVIIVLFVSYFSCRRHCLLFSLFPLATQYLIAIDHQRTAGHILSRPSDSDFLALPWMCRYSTGTPVGRSVRLFTRHIQRTINICPFTNCCRRSVSRLEQSENQLPLRWLESFLRARKRIC